MKGLRPVVEKATKARAARAATKAKPVRRRRKKGERIFDQWERDAWVIPEDIKPSEWAEKYRELAKGQTNIPGPWRNENAPYLRGIMDIPVARGVVETNLSKGGQVGASEAVRNIMSARADMSPDPMGLSLPDRAKGRKIVRNRIIPMFQDTPRLAKLLTGRKSDLQAEEIKLNNGFILHLMWAGSASSTASDPMRTVFNDEIDKFAAWAGAEPDAVGRTATRMRTYEDRRCQINLSTPTDQYSEIDQRVEESDFQLQYYVPCPHCDLYQYLRWEQVKWIHAKDFPASDRPANRIELAGRLVQTDRRVWYECMGCKGRIEEIDKAPMVRRGVWATEDPDRPGVRGGEIMDAEAVEEWPRETRIGMRISALYCLWDRWATNASAYLRAVGNPAKMYNFWTETLGLPFKRRTEKAAPSVFAGKVERATMAEGIVPEWAGRLVGSFDTQKDFFYGVIRAFGADFKSQRVWHGRCETFAEIEQICWKTPFACEQPDLGAMLCDIVVIDSGGTKAEDAASSRTQQVYQWAMKFRGYVRAIKGQRNPRAGQFVWRTKGMIDPTDGRRKKGKKSKEVPLWMFAKEHWQDILQHYILQGLGDKAKGDREKAAADEVDEEVWFLNQRSDEDYEAHLANAAKVMTYPKGVTTELWAKVHPGARWDYRDCEVYALIGAFLSNVQEFASDEEVIQMRASVAAQRREVQRQRGRKKTDRRDSWKTV